jgi:serine-threonine kinase receptor-associated protein
MKSPHAYAGHDKLIRLYDLDAPDVAPQTLPQAACAVRNVMWLQDDKVLLCTLLDSPGIK